MPERDEFDDPEGFFTRLVTHTGKTAGSIFDNRSLLISGAVFIAVVTLSGVIWASYPSQNSLGGGAIPIIRADAEPYKYVPADRGGMQIPHQDSTIFGAMRAADPDQRVENLLDDTEQPIDRSQLFAGLKTDLSTEFEVASAGAGQFRAERPMTEAERRAEAMRRNRELLEGEAAPLPGDDTTSDTRRLPAVLQESEVKPDLNSEEHDEAGVADAPKPKHGIEVPAPTEAKEEKEKEKPKGVAKDDAPKAKPDKKTATAPKPATPAPATGNGGTSWVQVASVPNAAAVAKEWAVVSGKLPLIAGMNYRTQTANLGAKGTYHRIQVGPMSKSEADALCAKIKAQKPGGCLVVK